MVRTRINRLTLIIILLGALQSVNAQVSKAGSSQAVVQMGFGGSRTISYDLKSGTFTISAGKMRVVYNTYAAVNVNGSNLSSKDYTKRRYSHTAVTDGFGTGQKNVITLTGKGLPTMEQVFYTYPHQDFLITEVDVAGEALSSNYMAPVIGDFLPVKGDVRSLFVPFDNDTFISYDARPFTGTVADTSSEVGAVYDNQHRNGLIAGSLEHGVWKTGVRTSSGTEGNQFKVWAGYSAESVTRDNIAHGKIERNRLQSPKMFIGYFSDWRKGLEEYGKANRIADSPFVFNWTKPTPVGWNSWGVLQDKLTYDKAVKVVDFFVDSLAAFRTGNTAYIDLDSYWDRMTEGGDYTKLKQFADYCKSKGLQPGVYWAPFTDWGHKGGPNRKVEGSNYTYGELWTKVGEGFHDIDGARALDPTHPGTRQRIDYFIGKLKTCGFTMIKIDFLGHAAAESTGFYDPAVKTGMQAYREGMEYLLSKLDGQMFVYAAISPSLATGRYVHARRIACDAFQTIAHTQYTLNSVTYGWWQTYLYNYIDADHVVLDHQTEGENRARMLSSIITGTFITGDDFSSHGPWSARAKEWYQNKELLKVVENGKAFEPVDGNTDKSASNMFTRQIGNNRYVAIFNYKKTPETFTIDAGRLGLPAGQSYQLVELLQGGQLLLNKTTEVNMPGADAKLFLIKLSK